MFRTVTQQLSFLEGVGASVKRFSTSISQAYKRQVTTVLQVGETFSAAWLTFFQETVTRLMEANAELLRQAERVHREALRKLKRLRQSRDQDMKALVRTLSQVRQTFDGTHGRGTSDLFLGLEANIFRASARVLLRYALEAIEMLLKPDFELPDTALRSTVLTPSEYAEQIRPPMDALRTTMLELEDQKRETEEAQKVRTTAFAKSGRTIIYGSRLLEALYILAGDEFHAKRLRPNFGQRVASVEEPDGVEPGDSEPGNSEPEDGEPSEGESSEGESSVGESSVGESSVGESNPQGEESSDSST